jgi:F-type H+-transporting ATPase subunit delta
MMDQQVAERYAEAIFNVAKEQKATAAVEADLEAMVNLLETSIPFHHFLFSPYVPRDEKLRIVDKLFTGKVSKLSLQALRLLLHKRREHELAGVHRAFVKLRRDAESTVHVTISSAHELSAANQKALADKAHKLTGRKVEADFAVEPSLMGGVKIAYENIVLDGTVRGNLDKLRDRLSFDLLSPV